MFIPKTWVRAVETRLSELDEQIRMLECNHRRTGFQTRSSPYGRVQYEKVCLRCNKSLGIYSRIEKLQEEKKQHQKELKKINKILKESK